jgi:uncharacterized membrane protein
MVTVPAVKWLPPLILGAAAALLGFLWDELPARWVVHWGFAGRADGWAAKTFLGVFGPLLLGAAILMMFEVMAQILKRKGPEQGASAILPLRIIAISLSLVLAASAVWLPLLQPSSPWSFIIFTVIVMGAGLTASMISSARAFKRMGVGRAPAEGYRGLIYKNPKDERLWVPKRFGWGWTLNFAHPAAWPTMLLLVSPAIIVLIVALLTTARH